MANVTAGKVFVSGETVTPASLNSLGVPTVTVADGEVTNAKIASGVDASKLTTGTLPADRIGTSAVTTARIADAAVTAGKLNGAQTGSAPIYGCRAWVNFDGTTVTNIDGEDRCTIRSSGNISKVVRNAAGDYSVVFTTAMPDANYCALTSTTDNNTQRCAVSLNRDGSVASGARVIVVAGMTNTLTNASHVDLAIFR